MGRQTQAQWDAKRAAAKAKAREALAKAAEDEPTTAPEDPEVLSYETGSDEADDENTAE